MLNFNQKGAWKGKKNEKENRKKGKLTGLHLRLKQKKKNLQKCATCSHKTYKSSGTIL